MRYRKLRIVWSVFWGLAAVLLIVLWVRSYWVWDLATARYLDMASAKGIATFCVLKPPNHLGWMWLGNPASEAIDVAKFEISSDQIRWSIHCPHWLPILVAAAFAGAPGSVDGSLSALY